MQAAEIRAMHCNDLDLDLPASRSEHVILRSAKLCEQLTGSNLSHPAVQNQHSPAPERKHSSMGWAIAAIVCVFGVKLVGVKPCRQTFSIQITKSANAEAAMAHTSPTSV